MRFIRRFGTYFPYSTNRLVLEEFMLVYDMMYHTPSESDDLNCVEVSGSMLVYDMMYHTPSKSDDFNCVEVSDGLDCSSSAASGSEPGKVGVEPLLVGTSVSFIQV